MTTVVCNNPHGTWVADAPGAALIAPGGGWDGTAGSVPPPAEDVTLRGLGFRKKPIGGFDEPKQTYMSSDLLITVLAETIDQDHIDRVVFYLEGGTFTQFEQAKSPRTGAVGLPVAIDHSACPRDGDAYLYADIWPVNGYKRRLGPMLVTITGTGVFPVTRPQRYIDWLAGSDSNNGLTAGTAWKTFLKAEIAAPDFTVVDCAAGTYLEDSNSGTINSNTRMITFRPGTGVADYDVKIDRTSRFAPENRWQTRCANVEFIGIQVDTARICEYQAGSNSGVTIFRRSKIIDSNGVTGPPEGYGNTNDFKNVFFRHQEGQSTYLLETEMVSYVTTGARMYRNADLEASADVVFLGGAVQSNDTVVLNTVARQNEECQIRRHAPAFLTVASATFDGTRTAIVWSGSPVIDAISAPGQANQNVVIESGAMTGQEFLIYSQTSGTFTTVVVGDASALAAGVHGRAYIVFHSDTGQQAVQATGGANTENVIFQNYDARGVTAQPIFMQAGDFAGPGTMSTVGTALTTSVAHGLVVNDFVRPTNGSQTSEDGQLVVSVEDATHATLEYPFSVDQSGRAWRKGKSVNCFAFQLCRFNHTGLGPEQTQLQHGHNHWVMRQSVHIGAWTTPGVTAGVGGTFSMRNLLGAGFGASDSGVRDSIIKTMGSDIVPMPDASTGWTCDNNHFEGGTARGTNADVGYPTYDVNLRPTSAVTRTIADPKLKWNALGEPLALDGSDLVGAIG